MTDLDNYGLRRDFEKWLGKYRQHYNGQSEEFTSYLLRWHQHTRLRDGIGDAVCTHLRIMAKEKFPKYPSPVAFLRYMFQDLPNPEELQRRFSGQSTKGLRSN
jgi:hypothetical protein